MNVLGGFSLFIKKKDKSHLLATDIVNNHIIFKIFYCETHVPGSRGKKI